MIRNSQSYSTVYLRIALGPGFLSGNFRNFLHYTATLNPWFPSSWIPTVGWIATICKAALGIALILGFQTRIAAYSSGLVTLLFALGMVFGIGIKAPLNYSVFAFSAGSFLLAGAGEHSWSVDGLLRPNSESALRATRNRQAA